MVETVSGGYWDVEDMVCCVCWRVQWPARGRYGCFLLESSKVKFNAA